MQLSQSSLVATPKGRRRLAAGVAALALVVAWFTRGDGGAADQPSPTSVAAPVSPTAAAPEVTVATSTAPTTISPAPTTAAVTTHPSPQSADSDAGGTPTTVPPQEQPDPTTPAADVDDLAVPTGNDVRPNGIGFAALIDSCDCAAGDGLAALIDGCDCAAGNGEIAGSGSGAPPDVLITVHRVHVDYDGDPGANRGELTLRWGFGTQVLGTRGEDKVSSGDTVHFGHAVRSLLVRDAEGLLPSIYVNAAERDNDGNVVEFCAGGTGLFSDERRDDGCDLAISVASSGLIGVDALAGMSRCSSFGLDGPLADAACIEIESPANGDTFARFSALLSFEFLD